MMGTTLLSVDAAELGDRALVDSLLPHSYRRTSKGPFLMLSETPTQQRRELRDRRRRLPPAGDLRLHRPPVRARAASSRPSTRCCLRSVTRLVLRNVHWPRPALRRGGGLHRPAHRPGTREPAMARRGRARSPAPGPSQAAPVLAFPEPGLDDPAAYQGYQTRFYRDSKRNTVQIYLEPRGGAGRQPGLGRRGQRERRASPRAMPPGRPAPLAWAAGQRGGERFGRASGASSTASTAEAPRVDAGLVRARLDAGRARLQLRPAAPPAVHRARRSVVAGGVAAGGATWRDCRRRSSRRHLALLRRGQPGRARGASRAPPSPARSATAGWLRARRAALARRPEPGSCWSSRRVAGAAPREPSRPHRRRSGRRTGRPVRFRMRVATDAEPLTPLAREEIFNREFLAVPRRPTLGATGRAGGGPAAGARGAGRRAAEQPGEADGRAAQLRHLLRPRHDDDRAHDAADLDAGDVGARDRQRAAASSAPTAT